MKKFSYKPGWRSYKSRRLPSPTQKRIVSNLKIGLPLAILIVFASIFIWPRVEQLIYGHNTQNTMETILKANPKLENKVIHPKYESLDKKGRPFIIEADQALLVSQTQTELFSPSGNMKLEDGSTLSFNSETGIYNKEGSILELNQNVHIKTDKGYDLKTLRLKLHVKNNIGETHDPVYGTGPSGESIKSEGLRITDKGDVIDFLGRTTISLPGTS